MLQVEQAMVKRLARVLDSLRRSAKELALGPDGKVLVLVSEDIDRPDAPPRWSLEQVTVSIQHAADWDALAAHAAIDARLRREAATLAAVVPGLSISPTLDLRINPVGDFVVGGPYGDNGLSGKKLVMDAYGPHVPIGGGATAGKDRWKVDRYGPKIARRMAVDAVLRHGYRECTVTLAISPGDRESRVAAIDCRKTQGRTDRLGPKDEHVQGPPTPGWDGGDRRLPNSVGVAIGTNLHWPSTSVSA